jgi:hypothetical protein
MPFLIPSGVRIKTSYSGKGFRRIQGRFRLASLEIQGIISSLFGDGGW